MQKELESGSWKVIAEARESGNVGLYRSGGEVRSDLIEEILTNIEPKFFKNIRGTHSFCFNSNVLAIDFVKYQK